MIQDQDNLNFEYFVQVYHLILEQILDVFSLKNYTKKEECQNLIFKLFN